MSKINKQWHVAHKMPKNPTPEQRIQWHSEHIQHCQCYPVSPKLQKEIDDFKNRENFLKKSNN